MTAAASAASTVPGDIALREGPRHSRPPIPQIAMLNRELGAAVTAVVRGEQTARAVLQDAHQRINLAIDEKRVE